MTAQNGLPKNIEHGVNMWPKDTPRPKGFTVNVNNLKDLMITLHLNHLHNTQLDMIDEAVLKSDMTEAQAVIKHIMEKK